ncbi:ATP-binding cassette domain-containing protein [Haloarchaeobius amylolyticus]|uniref:ATP-binding cassette domain-containing protein n=1 Tax=Haloarchaeobius amylolyticus TaxID=1198296 RepID=UPI00226D599D|nr:ABC transporter ATP-binding protein [Haloarchaeobius amylolyticus]
MPEESVQRAGKKAETPIVTASDLGKRFESSDWIFENLDIEIHPGETTILMGTNGVGKSILLSCLAGGLLPTTGSVTVFGKQPAEAQSQLTLLLQDGLAVEELSGRENAEFYSKLHPAATDAWREIADQLELEGMDRRVREYSGGMAQKLELALTLSVDVPLYFLDEPTSELDPTAVERFHGLLEELVTEGKTVVLSSHSPRDLRAADRVIFVSSTGIVADGDPSWLHEAVPPVVVVEGHTEQLEEVLRGGRLFDTDAGRRGFLADDVDPEEVTDRESVVGVESPKSPDMFNYYAHIH